MNWLKSLRSGVGYFETRKAIVYFCVEVARERLFRGSDFYGGLPTEGGVGRRVRRGRLYVARKRQLACVADECDFRVSVNEARRRVDVAVYGDIVVCLITIDVLSLRPARRPSFPSVLPPLRFLKVPPSTTRLVFPRM